MPTRLDISGTFEAPADAPLLANLVLQVSDTEADLTHAAECVHARSGTIVDLHCECCTAPGATVEVLVLLQDPRLLEDLLHDLDDLHAEVN